MVVTFFLCNCFLDFVVALKLEFNMTDFIDLAEQNGVMR